MLPLFGDFARPVDDRGRRSGRRLAPRARAARRRGDDRPPLPDLLALQDAARLPRRRRLVHRGGRDPAADARRERDRRMDAAAVRQAHGRLAPQHGRLEHLAQALLRAAAPVLRMRVRRPERDRLARRARGARRLGSRRSAGAAPAVDRRRAHPLRAVRPRRRAHPRGRRRLARRRHRQLLDARLAQSRSGRSTATRPARRPGSRAPTCPITRTGRSGSRRTGSRRCASRSGSGSTRSASWP